MRYTDFINVMNEGIIAIDKSGLLKNYSEKTKEIMGIKRYCKFPHKSGRIKKGDIVIIAETSLGVDDGGLTLKDLKMIGMVAKKADKGSPIIAIGTYGDNKNPGLFKSDIPKHNTDKLTLKEKYKNLDINVKIDFLDRCISIIVNNIEYKCNYFNNFGHAVIIDGVTKQMKFYQNVGYSAWKEDNKLILAGERFNTKESGINELNTENKHILEMHRNTNVINDLINCANGSCLMCKEKIGVINGIRVLYGINGVNRNDERIGAILLIEDISRLENIEYQKNVAYKKLKNVEAKLQEENDFVKLFPKIIGSSTGMLEIKKLALKASKSNSNVLILGESGTGKSILAREIHEIGDNKKPFIQINCTSIPENLLESELFGYEKGAFTGANIKGKKGYFEMANGGTIFLDEIGEISQNMQAKLLQVIQNKKFFKVGGNKEILVDVRIIVATNKNLETEVKKKRFREDLYYRINVFPINVIPLRDRKEDIFELVEFLVPKICERIGCELKRISGEALNKLMMYLWPGNIRELENVLERAVNLCDDKTILSRHIRINIEKKNTMNTINYIKSLKETLEQTEKEAIKSVMKYTKGNKKEAMEILEIKKTSLYEKLKNI